MVRVHPKAPSLCYTVTGPYRTCHPVLSCALRRAGVAPLCSLSSGVERNIDIVDVGGAKPSGNTNLHGSVRTIGHGSGYSTTSDDSETILVWVDMQLHSPL